LFIVLAGYLCKDFDHELTPFINIDAANRNNCFGLQKQIIQTSKKPQESLSCGIIASL
jgi:hypothetical protein